MAQNTPQTPKPAGPRLAAPGSAVAPPVPSQGLNQQAPSFASIEFSPEDPNFDPVAAIEQLAEQAQAANPTPQAPPAPTPQAAKPPEAKDETNVHGHNCKRCGWDQRNPIETDPTDDDLRAYRESLLTGAPFAHTFRFMDGDMIVLMREPLPQEPLLVSRQSAETERRNAGVSPMVLSGEQLRNRAIMQLQSLRLGERTVFGPSGFSQETHPGSEGGRLLVKPTDTGQFSRPPYLTEAVDRFCVANNVGPAVLNVLTQCVMDLDNLRARLSTEVYSGNFRMPTGRSSS